MAKRIVCLLLAALAAVNLYVPAFAEERPVWPGVVGGVFAAVKTDKSLPAPTVTIAQTKSGIQVTWNAVKGSPRYMVYYKENGGSWHKIGTTAKTSYTRKASALKNGVTYQFTVRCCAADKKTLLGPYKASNKIKYTVELAAPTVTIAQTSGGIQVSWNKVSGSPRYMVYYRENGGSWQKIGTTDKTSYTRKASVLKNGVTYQFTVRCCAADKKTLLSTYKASNKVKYTFKLSAPKVTIAQTSGGIQVTWNAVKGSPRYMVYYRENGGSWHKIGTTAKTSYTRKASVLKNAVTYQFTVRCCDSDKKTLLSTYKASNKIKYAVKLSTPKLSAVTNAAGGVEVTWGAVKGASKYRVFYKTGSGSWKRAGETAGTSYTVTCLTSGKTYAFTVRCLSADGKSYVSGYDKTGKSVAYYAAPKVKLVNVNNGMKATWNKVAGASKYKVYFRAKGSGGWNLLGSTTSASYIWDDAVLGMSYAFTVRAVGKSGTSAYQSSGYVKYTGAASSASPTDT